MADVIKIAQIWSFGEFYSKNAASDIYAYKVRINDPICRHSHGKT